MAERISACSMVDGMTYIGEYEKRTMSNFIIVPTIELVQDKRAYHVAALERYKQKNKSKKTELILENIVASTEITKE